MEWGATLFHDLPDARLKIERWRLEYNTERPHSSLNYETPEQVAQRYAARRPENDPAVEVLAGS